MRSSSSGNLESTANEVVNASLEDTEMTDQSTNPRTNELTASKKRGQFKKQESVDEDGTNDDEFKKGFS